VAQPTPSEAIHRKGSAPARILFVPVSGPTGIGEYQRSLFFAEKLLDRHPGWDVRIVVAEDAPFVDDVPLPALRTTRSPTEVPDELDRILDRFRPDVVVFDSAGRRRNLRHAKSLGARTVFVSTHARKRWKAFRVSRLRHTDEHWIARPELVAGGVTPLERLKLRWLGKPDPLFLGPVFPEPVTPAHAPSPPYFVCCPGGGGNQVLGRQSGAVFADAAVATAGELGMTGVVVTGANYTGSLPEAESVVAHRGLPGAELAGLIASAAFGMVGGGDLLQQAIAMHTPCVTAPAAPDQPGRIAAFDRVRLCVSSPLETLAETTTESFRSGALDRLRERLERSDAANGLMLGVERIEALAAG
jgi:hypothetical protein